MVVARLIIKFNAIYWVTLIVSYFYNMPWLFFAIAFLFFAANLEDLIQCLEGDKLMNFCKILAVAVSDRDMHENKICCKYI